MAPPDPNRTWALDYLSGAAAAYGRKSLSLGALVRAVELALRHGASAGEIRAQLAPYSLTWNEQRRSVDSRS